MRLELGADIQSFFCSPQSRPFWAAIIAYLIAGKNIPTSLWIFTLRLFKIKGGGPHFLDSQGSCWTAAYIQEGGNVVRDLRANISAEAGARQTYESLIKACDDEGTKKTLHHLLTREITHANMFMKALDQMGKLDDPFFGNIPPDETVKLVFNLSQGEDERGPWNEEPDFDYVENPVPEGGLPPDPINPDDEGHKSSPGKARTSRRMN
jgi:manganese catalase